MIFLHSAKIITAFLIFVHIVYSVVCTPSCILLRTTRTKVLHQYTRMQQRSYVIYLLFIGISSFSLIYPLNWYSTFKSVMWLQMPVHTISTSKQPAAVDTSQRVERYAIKRQRTNATVCFSFVWRRCLILFMCDFCAKISICFPSDYSYYIGLSALDKLNAQGIQGECKSKSDSEIVMNAFSLNVKKCKHHWQFTGWFTYLLLNWIVVVDVVECLWKYFGILFEAQIILRLSENGNSFLRNFWFASIRCGSPRL